MKQFLAAVLVAVLVLPSVSQAAWTRFEDSYVFGDFVYNESTDEWVHDDGTYYESSAELFDCYGFYYDSWRDVWYNEDGYIDEDMCVRDHSDGGYFYCDSCEIFMYDTQSDNPENHHDECAYIEEIGGYEDESNYDYYDDSYDYSDSYDPPDTNEPEEGTDIEKDEKYSFIRILGLIVLLFFAGWPIVAFFITFVCAAIGAFRRK